ncbi:5-oxoprolinase subunit PxpB [Sporolactobacillus sp. THM7-4]|nr:5-oxoprolinase subunit PxpB [Sporolactobacillus sp. THM7-4]
MGEQIIILKFDDVLSIELNQKIQRYAQAIKEKKIKGIKNLITAMNTLSIVYDPRCICEQRLKELLLKISIKSHERNESGYPVIHIPITFDEKYAPDLLYISEQTGLSKEAIIKVIISKTYYVYMIGFIAGIPYMGNLDRRLIVPRRSSPRVRVPKGSLAIANQMINIYTIESPGGWHLIGWTPMNVFNAKRDPPCLISAGTYVKYEPISVQEAETWNETRQREWDAEWPL